MPWMRKRLHGVGLGFMLISGVLIGTVQAAELPLQTLEGETVHLSDYVGEGHWLLVMLWATNCPVCSMEKPKISAFHQKHQDGMARVLGIALDGPEHQDDVIHYLDAHPTAFPNLIGRIGDVALSYEVATTESLRGTPTYLLYTPDGELIGNNPGPLSEGAVERFIAKYNQL